MVINKKLCKSLAVSLQCVTCCCWFVFFSVLNMDEENEMLLEYKLQKVDLSVLCPQCQIFWLYFGCSVNTFKLFLQCLE